MIVLAVAAKVTKMRDTVKISLVNPPPLKGVYRHQPYLPIGLAYLAAVLEEKGHEVSVVDCPALEMNHENLKKELTSIEPHIIGITSMTPTIQSALLSAHTAKESCPDATTVLGGPHATFMDKQVLIEEEAVDVIVRGEGEQTLKELAQNVSNAKSLNKIEGITFRNNNGQPVRTPKVGS